MSSCDDYTLEFFVEDSFMNVTDDEIKKIIHLLESERDWIEYKMIEDYNEEEHSWRDYRNSMWYNLEDYEKRINTILGI